MVDIAYNQAEKQRAMEAGLSLEKAVVAGMYRH